MDIVPIRSQRRFLLELTLFLVRKSHRFSDIRASTTLCDLFKSVNLSVSSADPAKRLDRFDFRYCTAAFCTAYYVLLCNNVVTTTTRQRDLIKPVLLLSCYCNKQLKVKGSPMSSNKYAYDMMMMVIINPSRK